MLDTERDNMYNFKNGGTDKNKKVGQALFVLKDQDEDIMKPRKIQDVLYEKVKDRMLLKGLMQKKEQLEEFHLQRALSVERGDPPVVDLKNRVNKENQLEKLRENNYR